MKKKLSKNTNPINYNDTRFNEGKTTSFIAGRGLREASSMASGQERSGPYP